MEKAIKIKQLIWFLTVLSLFLCIIPILSYLNYIYIFSLLIVICISLKINFNKRFVLNTLAIIFIIFSLKNISFNNIAIPIIHSLCILVCAKFLEDKKYRDYMQLFALFLFIFAVSTLIEIKLKFFIFLLIFLFILTFATVILTFYKENENIALKIFEIKKVFYVSFLIFFMSLFLSVIFFFILPRIDKPFFNFLNQEHHVTGFSEDIKLGNFSEIQENKEIILRVKMPKVNRDFLYWRGKTLDFFDGKTWSKKKFIETEELPSLKGVYLIEQEIYLEPYMGNYLFAIDKPIKILLKDVKIYNDLSFYRKSIINKRIKYQAVSFITQKLSVNSKINLFRYLQLPEYNLERIKKLAFSLKANDTLKTIQNILDYFAIKNFNYSLKDLPVSNNPIENFLFKYKKGNCEYFASSMAILLRILKIPSRLVVGYKGGVYNEFGKYYMIRQSDAHVWVEALINNKYWLRIDPVSVVASSNKSNFSKIRELLDALNYYWIQIVINYNFQKQLNILIGAYSFSYNLKFSKKDVFFITLIFAIFFLILFLSFAFLKSSQKTYGDKLLDILKRKGISIEKHEGFYEIMKKIQDDKLKLLYSDFIAIYFKEYYKDLRLSKEDRKKVRNLLRQIKNYKL